MLNKLPVEGEEVTLTRYTEGTITGSELHPGYVGTVHTVEDDRVRVDFVVSDLPGNNPDAMESEDCIWITLDELPDYLSGYHWEDPANED